MPACEPVHLSLVHEVPGAICVQQRGADRQFAVVEIEQDGAKRCDADASRDQDVLVARSVDDEIAVRLAHFDRRANGQSSESALEATAPFAGEAGGEHDVPLERRRRNREVPGGPSIVRVRMWKIIVEELPRLPFERRITSEHERHDVLSFGSLFEEDQLHTLLLSFATATLFITLPPIDVGELQIAFTPLVAGG